MMANADLFDDDEGVPPQPLVPGFKGHNSGLDTQGLNSKDSFARSLGLGGFGMKQAEQ
jgi:hypothetical protein